MTRSAILKATTALALALAVAGCPDTAIEFQANDDAAHAGDIGLVRIAVVASQPWGEIAGSLDTELPSNAETALSEVVPSVTAFEERVLDALGVSLALAFSPTTVPGEDENVPDDPPGTGDSANIPGDRTAGGLPGLTDAQRSSVLEAIDPITKYRTANALLQEIAILNNAVRLATQRDGYVPYFVRLQLTAIPFVRHQPYDLFTQVSFFVGDEPGATTPATKDSSDSPTESPPEDPSENQTADHEAKLPVVVPLLVTDNLEASSHARSASIIRQIGFAISLIQAGRGGALDFNRLSERQESVFGRDLNSLFTIGLVGENAILARIGARRNPVSDYEFSEGTHAVSLLLLIPKEEFPIQCNKSDSNDSEERRFVRLISDSQFRHATERSVVPIRPPEVFREEFETLFQRFRLITADGEPLYELNEDGSLIPHGELGKMITAIQTSNPADFRTAFESFSDSNDSDDHREALWAAMSGIIARSGYATTAFSLPPFVKPDIPADQTPIVVPGTDGRDRAVLYIGDGANPLWTHATLEVTKDEGTYKFPALATAPGPSAGTVEVSFPSLSSTGLQLEAGNIGSMEVEHRPALLEEEDCAASQDFSAVLYQPPPPAKTPPQPTGTASANISINLEAEEERRPQQQ